MAQCFGFIGLGQMGGPMAANIAGGGFSLVVHDQAGTHLGPDGAQGLDSNQAVARESDSIFLSLPDGAISLAVVDEIAATEDRRSSVIIDLSTIGPEAARAADQCCRAAGITYIDAPVSGGQAGARAGTITIMLAGTKTVVDAHDDVFKSFSANPFYVGETPGQGQALKILNNFLSGTAMAATSEAMLYGLSEGLDMKTMLDVVNVSTGQNTASRDKFPQRILCGTFDAGFKTELLAKDVRLFFDNANAAGTPVRISEAVTRLWEDTNRALPNSDFTRVYEFIRDEK